MLRRVTDIVGCRVTGTDGDIGTVRDVYFDDEQWVVRYLVVSTDGWLGPDVLITPVVVSSVAWDDRAVKVGLTKDEVADSPSINLHKPASRREETRYYAYFGLDPYWTGAAIWPTAGAPGLMADETLASIRARRSASQAEQQALDASSGSDVHLRSANEVKGYHIQASDGRIGHADDFLLDEITWEIRIVDVDTSNWIGAPRSGSTARPSAR
ncbi:MAG: PRC-barrel domain-containing protein [Vicinamibacterales bacterium]